jgi:thiamine-phosphate pyrophosphorylase
MKPISLQFISHPTERYDYVAGVRMALSGGCRWIQLRMKESSTDQILATGRVVRELCRQAGATFIIDDHVELVQTLGADGVHLGRNDMPVADARRVLGKDYIIGGTANTFADIERLAAQGADYIGCGPFRFTTTKQNLSPTLGLEGYARLLEQMRAAEIALPLVAIGGITAADIAPLHEVGVDGIALSGSVLRADDPVAAMRNVLALWQQSER